MISHLHDNLQWPFISTFIGLCSKDPVSYFSWDLSYSFNGNGQDSTAITWEAVLPDLRMENIRLIFNAHIKPGWELYAPNQDLSGTPSMELIFYG